MTTSRAIELARDVSLLNHELRTEQRLYQDRKNAMATAYQRIVCLLIGAVIQHNRQSGSFDKMRKK